MLIKINTDNNVEGSERFIRHFSSIIESSLDRFSQHITRIEAHIRDENSHKESENDKRCLLEARLKGMQPITVTHQANTIEEAVSGATDKLVRTLDTTIGKLRNY